ncbi:XkdX family protein [Clostridium sp.]|uniref:XkdX family protein n=1 Tax=Clostridium sp. TaxID=1506 RepID=UPI002FC8C2CD
MLTFEKIKGYYVNGLWSKTMVWDSINCPKPKITQQQYTEITGEECPVERPS